MLPFLMDCLHNTLDIMTKTSVLSDMMAEPDMAQMTTWIRLSVST
jgi:hypothetical protein